jgi:hypothetical protein
MFKQFKELVRWTTTKTKVLQGIGKFDDKKDVYHSTLIIEVLM